MLFLLLLSLCKCWKKNRPDGDIYYRSKGNFIRANYKCIFMYVILTYRKIPNISPGLIEVRKPFLGGLYSGGLIFGGYFVLVSKYKNLKIHCRI